MTKINDALRRADRATGFAVLFVIATVTGAASSADISYTDRPSTAQVQPAMLRGATSGADREVATLEMPQAPMPANAIAAEPSATELAMVKIAAEQRCLAEAMYYEARGEGRDGEEAIAEVIFHRMHRRGYPGSICGVVYQGANDGAACQFSFVCNGEMERPKSRADWARANLLAARILSGYVPLGDATDGATSFHAADIEPDWSGSLERTVQIGNHVFYKPLARTRAS